MTDIDLAAIRARDVAVGTGNHARKQYGPTAVWAIRDRRVLLDALRTAERDLQIEREQAMLGYDQMLGWVRRAEAAEAREARLREATKALIQRVTDSYQRESCPICGGKQRHAEGCELLGLAHAALAPTEPEAERP